MVIAMLRSDAVDRKIMVDEKVRWLKEITWKEAVLTAEMVPPAVPTAGREKTWSNCVGMKDRNFGSENASSFDSCNNAT